MAQLIIKIGSLSSTINASDAKAAEVLKNVASLYEFKGNNQEKLVQINEMLRNFLTHESVRYKMKVDEKAAMEAAAANKSIRFEE